MRQGAPVPPARLVREASLVLMPGALSPREGRAWPVTWHGRRGVLRQTPANAVSAAGAHAGIAWLHRFLARLAGTGFPGPVPLPCFGGQSWTTSGGAFWEVLSFVPGHAVGWAAAPPMADIGALMGRYHLAARTLTVTGQRPGALVLADVPAVLLSSWLDVVPVHQRDIIRRCADRLARDMDAVAAVSSERLVIHGDFTTDNVIADGMPPRLTGVIDFANAHTDSPLADVGYGLWRSGRPHEQSERLDFSRTRAFLRGYASVAPVSAQEAAAIPVYLAGRGLQMIAKRVLAGRNETAMLAQVQWLHANASAVAEEFATALR